MFYAAMTHTLVNLGFGAFDVFVGPTDASSVPQMVRFGQPSILEPSSAIAGQVPCAQPNAHWVAVLGAVAAVETCDKWWNQVPTPAPTAAPPIPMSASTVAPQITPPLTPETETYPPAVTPASTPGP
jgi:hypothetical protein